MMHANNDRFQLYLLLVPKMYTFAKVYFDKHSSLYLIRKIYENSNDLSERVVLVHLFGCNFAFVFGWMKGSILIYIYMYVHPLCSLCLRRLIEKCAENEKKKMHFFCFTIRING